MDKLEGNKFIYPIYSIWIVVQQFLPIPNIIQFVHMEVIFSLNCCNIKYFFVFYFIIK